MTNEELIAAIGEWAVDFERRIAELETGLDKRVQAMQKDLYDLVRDVLSVSLDVQEGRLKNWKRNVLKVAQLEDVFNRFERLRVHDELAGFSSELMSVAALTGSYFSLIGEPITEAMEETQADIIRSVIGVDPRGNIVTDGYLHRLGKSAEVRQFIRDFVVQSIVSARTLKELFEGLKNLIVGATDEDGALQKYWRLYAYDTYNQAHEITNLGIAAELDLQYFIYQGSIIQTSRKFCVKRAGKVFSKTEALTWKDDPDLIDPKTAASYNPFIERGRYNCRHFLNWISEDLAAHMRPELKKK